MSLCCTLYFLFFFWLCHTTYGILVPQLEIEPRPSAVKVLTTRLPQNFLHYTHASCLFYNQYFLFLNPFSYLASPPSPLLTSNHQSVLCICGSVLILSYSFICVTFQIPYTSENVQHHFYLTYFIKFNTLQVYPCYCKMAKSHSFMVD